MVVELPGPVGPSSTRKGNGCRFQVFPQGFTLNGRSPFNGPAYYALSLLDVSEIWQRRCHPQGDGTFLMWPPVKLNDYFLPFSDATFLEVAFSYSRLFYAKYRSGTVE